MTTPDGLARRLWIVLAAVAAITGGEPARGQDTLAAIELGGLDTRSAALMLSAQEAGDLEVSALAIPLPDPADSGKSRVTLVVDVGDAALLDAAAARPTAAGRTLIVEVYAYALDGDNALIDSLTQAFRLDLERHHPLLSAGGGGVKFFGDLDLPAGSYSLRVLVLQRSSGRLGLRILPLEVPSWGAGPLLLPPVRREPPAGWILVQTAGRAPAFPVSVDGQPWVPSARRELDAGERAGYLLLGRELDRGLRAQLVDESHAAQAEIGLGDLRPVAGGAPGLEALAAEIDAAAVEAGEYRLRISAADGPAAVDSVPLVVRPSAGGRPESAEPDGLSRRDSRGRQAAFERLEAVRHGYDQALDRLAAGDRAGALEPLIEIERSRIGSGSAEEQKRLATAQLEIARELSGPSPEQLLAVIRIHEALYRRYHRQQRYLLATHSRQVVSLLAELYLVRSRSPRADHLVACALASLAGYLQQTGALPAAELAYLDALAHDPDHPAALIGLAAIQESFGQYEHASVLLQRLHKQQPDDTQARLRLGVNLRRLDKARRAVDHLSAAISEPGPEWVAAVAAQELAGLHAGEKRLGDAIAVLEEAAARHSENQRLKVQLAALLDHAGRRGEALTVLDGLDPTAGSDASSPRLVYSRAPTAAITAARRALEEESDRLLAARTSGGS